MSQGGRSDRIGILREAVARIEAGGDGFVNKDLMSGEALLRRRFAFFEIAPRTMADAPAAAGFALAAAKSLRGEAGGPLLWIAEEFALAESGAPHPPGLCAHGFSWGDFVLMRLPRRADVEAGRVADVDEPMIPIPETSIRPSNLTRRVIRTSDHAIAEGGFASIFVGTFEETKVAIKVIKPSYHQSSDRLQKVRI